MKIYPTLFVTALVVISLGACKEAQLSGPVAGAEIRIDLLNQPGASYQNKRTTTSADVIQQFDVLAWNGMGDAEKFLRIGNFEVDEELVDTGELYLVVASMGKDYDSDRDGKYDYTPGSVMGEWHAIMPGAALLADANLVSALTEAAYQYVRDDLGLISDEELLSRLDEFATVVVSDVDGDGDVDYGDVLRWTRLYSEDQYRGDIALLDNLADAIKNNEADYVVLAAAQSVWLNETVLPVRPPSDLESTLIGGTVQGDMVLTRDMSPYALSNSLTVEGDLVIEPGTEINGRSATLTVFGDLHIGGAPRQPAVLKDLNIIDNNWLSGSGSSVRYANFYQGRLTAVTQILTMEDSHAVGWQLTIKSQSGREEKQTSVRRNIFESSQVFFQNQSTGSEAIRVEFSNNVFVPSPSDNSTITTGWEAPAENLIVQNNSLHGNMQILRSGSNPLLDLRNNYWVSSDGSAIDFNKVIPDNASGGFPGEVSSGYIPYMPQLRQAHPDTPFVQ